MLRLRTPDSLEAGVTAAAISSPPVPASYARVRRIGHVARYSKSA